MARCTSSLSNIGACMAVVDIVQSTLGPRGMDKLIYDDNGKTTISNDGATIMNMCVPRPYLSTRLRCTYRPR